MLGWVEELVEWGQYNSVVIVVVAFDLVELRSWTVAGIAHNFG